MKNKHIFFPRYDLNLSDDLIDAQHQNRFGIFCVDEKDVIFGFDSKLDSVFRECVAVTSERDVLNRSFLYYAYSMWFDIFTPPSGGHVLFVVPKYSWFIGSRNRALICVRER